MKPQLLPRGIRVYFWTSRVRVWADGKDDTRGIYVQRRWGFFSINPASCKEGAKNKLCVMEKNQADHGNVACME